MEHNKRSKKSVSNVSSIMNEHKVSESPLATQENSNPGMNASDNLLRPAFLMEVRYEAITEFRGDQDEPRITIDLLIKMCQALVKSNREIWDRCKPFYCDRVKSNDTSTEKCTFFRVRGFVRANTRLVEYNHFGDPSARNNELTLEAGPYVNKRAFNIPISLPPRFEYLVGNPRPDEDDIMPDFGLVLRRSMLLIDDVVPSFLRDFKALLESQQVAIGKVDEWLFHDRYEPIFTKLDQHGLDAPRDMNGLFEIEPHHAKRILKNMEKCFKCRQYFESHDQDAETGWVQCRTDTGHGCFPFCKKTKKLLCCPFSGSLEFQVSAETPEERFWLIKCLEFVGADTTELTQR